MQGRIHFYEGYSLKEVTFPIKVMKKLGIEKILITNAAGAVNETFEVGSLMLIKDHINLLGTNPLVGANDEKYGPRFPSMSEAYAVALREKMRNIAASLQIKLYEGVYFFFSPP